MSLGGATDYGPRPKPHEDWGISRDNSDDGGAEKGASGTRAVPAGPLAISNGTLRKADRSAGGSGAAETGGGSSGVSPKYLIRAGQASRTVGQSASSKVGASAMATYSATTTAFRSLNTRRLAARNAVKLLLTPHVST